jgi:hypothetical protein
MVDLHGQGKRRREAYLEQLKDPQWQRKRLEIFQLDKWTCQRCCRTDKTLNVHHMCYRPNTRPWDYESEVFLTLCTDCHEAETLSSRAAQQEIWRVLHEIPWTSEMLEMLGSMLDDLCDITADTGKFFHTLGARLERIAQLNAMIRPDIFEDSPYYIQQARVLYDRNMAYWSEEPQHASEEGA